MPFSLGRLRGALGWMLWLLLTWSAPVVQSSSQAATATVAKPMQPEEKSTFLWFWQQQGSPQPRPSQSNIPTTVNSWVQRISSAAVFWNRDDASSIANDSDNNDMDKSDDDSSWMNSHLYSLEDHADEMYVMAKNESSSIQDEACPDESSSSFLFWKTSSSSSCGQSQQQQGDFMSAETKDALDEETTNTITDGTSNVNATMATNQTQTPPYAPQTLMLSPSVSTTVTVHVPGGQGPQITTSVTSTCANIGVKCQGFSQPTANGLRHGNSHEYGFDPLSHFLLDSSKSIGSSDSRISSKASRTGQLSSVSASSIGSSPATFSRRNRQTKISTSSGNLKRHNNDRNPLQLPTEIDYTSPGTMLRSDACLLLQYTYMERDPFSYVAPKSDVRPIGCSAPRSPTLGFF
eukprot:CAMPEP_0172447964 /NCGR_PEP_ID=MMETSP1065-20121228/7090_1 /TAXON_ID=265537 /ORGANISM="Amphiprora paludosa, Strain CCMP125" /LENGTH=404 /DNA_ID=CAMNT_0013199337 /DNA_START=50 /DNA_END=1264 /DNA_ORIENTATION=-